MAQYPTISLQPGQSGNEVKQLQEFLISQGLLKQGLNTGYYGDLTKAAVAKLQQSLGVDVAGYPGYWGPRTLSALSNIDLGTEGPITTTTPSTQAIAAETQGEQTPTIEPAQPTQPTQGDWWAQATSPQGERYKIGPFTKEKLAVVGLREFLRTNPNFTGDPNAIGSTAFYEAGTKPFTGTISSTDVSKPISVTGDINFDTLINQFSDLLKNLISTGYQVNPNIKIGPEQIAEFTKVAESEINPYYKNQLKVARDYFLRNTGYVVEDIELLEQQLEQKYPQAVRQLGEVAAEKGLALSGQRQLEEKQLAEDYSQQFAQARRIAQRQTTDLASQFAGEYGTRQLPTSPMISTYQAIPGEGTFRKGTELPLYQLSQDVYQDLVGSKEYEQKAAIARRKAELAGLTRELGGIEEVRKLYV